MADIISRLKLESGEFDSKIKRAGQELLAYSEHCKKMGLQMGYANRDAKDFAKALGSMSTVSNTARGKINELSEAFVNAKVMYKNMTDAEKNSEFGKNLAASLDKLKVRLDAAKKDLADVTKELNGLSDVNVGGGGFLSGLGGKMGGALQVFGGNIMTKGLELASGAVMTLVNSIQDGVAQGLELAKAGEGIRIAFERLGSGDILQGLRDATHGTVTDIELMKAAVKFNDFKLPLDELGTMLAFAQKKAKDTGQSVDYMVDSIVTGLGRKSLMILDNLGLSAAEIKSKMKETGDMTKAVGAIIREQMTSSGDYIETAADRAKKQEVELKNAMEELGRSLQPLVGSFNSFWNSIQVGGIKLLNNVLVPILNNLTEAGRIANQYNDMGGRSKVDTQLSELKGSNFKNLKYNSIAQGYMNQISDLQSKIQDRSGSDAYSKQIRENLQEQLSAVKQQLREFNAGAKDIFNPKQLANTVITGDDDGKKKTKELDELQKIHAKIADLTKEAYTADESRIQAIQKEIAGLQEQEKKLISIRDLVTGKGTPGFSMSDAVFTTPGLDLRGNNGKAQDKLDLATAAFATSGTSNVDFSNYTTALQNAIKDANLGSELYTQLSEQLRDTTTVSTLLQELMERGMTGADLERTAQALKEKLLSPDGIDQSAIQSFLEEYSRQIEEAGGVGLKLNTETGEVSDKEKKENDLTTAINKATVGINALSNINSGLKGMGIDLGEDIGNAISFVQSLMTVIQGVQAIVSLFQTPAIVTNTFALETLTATLIAKSFLPGFASGGIVPAFAHGGLLGRAAAGMMIPGNSMSGDNLRLPVDGGRGMIGVNSGELILNKSSQNTLAADLLNAAALISSIRDYSVSLGNAQQTILAQELEGGGFGRLQLETIIESEDIRIVLNNNGRRTGRGEYVQSNRG